MYRSGDVEKNPSQRIMMLLQVTGFGWLIAPAGNNAGE